MLDLKLISKLTRFLYGYSDPKSLLSVPSDGTVFTEIHDEVPPSPCLAERKKVPHLIITYKGFSVTTVSIIKLLAKAACVQQQKPITKLIEWSQH